MTIVGERVVTLASGTARCEIVPSIGGAIAGFWSERDGRRIDWLRPASPAALAEGDAQRLACFPMVPYGNRIRSGRFLFCGREVIESPAAPDTRHAMHGHGWRQEWTIVDQTDNQIVLEYDHAPDAWPWCYRARQRIALTPDGLSLTLDVENLSDGLMPAGLGFHPFFPRTPNATLTAAATGVWLTDAEVMPTERTAVPPHWDLSAGRRVAELALDNVFTGWTGKAVLAWPERNAILALDASQPLLSFLVIHTPRHGDYFCVEPASHCTDAINLAREGVAETGLRVLAPGVRRSATVRLSPEFV